MCRVVDVGVASRRRSSSSSIRVDAELLVVDEPAAAAATCPEAASTANSGKAPTATPATAAAPSATPATAAAPSAATTVRATEDSHAIDALAAQLQAEGVSFVPPPGESRDDTLKRFLDARQGNVPKAAAFLAADAAWRDEQRIDELRALGAEEVLGGAAAVAGLLKVLPVAYGTGVDRLGRPIVYKHFGHQCKLSRMLDVTSLEQIYRYNAWLNEQLTLCLAEAAATKWTVVIDAAGWHWGLADATCFRILKHMADVDANHYPERLACILIINAPPAIAAVWRIVSRWLDDVTRAKVDIISDRKPEQARARLESLALPSQRPEQYGGTLPALAGWPAKGGLA